MKPKIAVPLLIFFVLIWGTIEFFMDYSAEMNNFRSYSSVIAQQMNRDLDDVVSMLSVFKIDSDEKLPSNVKGFAVIDLSGKMVSSSGDFNAALNYRTTNLYKFVFLNGIYTSPLGMIDGKPVFTLATRSKDRKYIMAIKMTPAFLIDMKGFQNFLVDGTGFGVSVHGTTVWKNFSAVLAGDRPGPYMIGNDIVDVEKIDFGDYSFIFMKPFPPVLFSILRGIVISISFILIIFIFVYYLTYVRFRKNHEPLIDFASFIGSSDSFKKYEPSRESRNRIFENYNALVKESDKSGDEFARLSEDFRRLNSELFRINEFYLDFSMLFSDTKNNRSDFEDALKIMMRRILDFSKTVTGVGLQYKNMIINLGSVTIIDFDRIDASKFTLDLRTELNTAKFVIGFDKFTVTGELKEMVKTLLYQMTMMMSMHELMEKNEASARYDPLTGLLTRQEFVALSERELARAKRMNSPISFIVFDIKNFKDFNEKYGTLNGDVLLKFIGKTLTTSTRITDISCRYGEDEFILCLVDANKPEASKKLDSILLKIFAFKYKINMRTSIISYPNDGETLEILLMAAEQSIKMQKK